jgi:hypothetical protein
LLLAGALAFAGLLAPPTTPTVFGVAPGMNAAQLKTAFAPRGQVERATWSTRVEDDITVLAFDCKARRRCFAVPRHAEFRLRGGRLVDAELTLDSVGAPEGLSPNHAAAEALGRLGPPAIKTSAAGRRTRYYLGSTWTIAWSIDGPDGRVMLAQDAASPLTRAEAVAAGAPDAGLDALPGARAYALGHAAIQARALHQAAQHFDAVLATPGASPLLKTPTRLVLAMVLAAQVKRAGQLDAKARAQLTRAAMLAPALKPDLDALRSTLRP